MSTSPGIQPSLRIVEDVLQAVRGQGADAVLIGGLALAVHQFPRDTTDLDLAVALEPRVLHALAAALATQGYEVAVRDPDPDDPLGGVLDVRSSDGSLVQVVNFLNPPAGGFPRLVRDALATALPVADDSTLRVADLPHLIAFKLYAGGRKSALDIVELVERNPGLDLPRLKALCASYRLDGALARILGAGDR